MENKIYITQLIYLIDGQEDQFNEFELIAIPIIQKYNGILLFRLKPDVNDYIECCIENPYEIHLVQFESQADFHSFMKDEERKKFLHLKEQSIRETFLIQGTKL